MEQNDQAAKLIDKYLSGDCTAEEKILVERFYLDQFKRGYLPENRPVKNIKSAMWNYINENKKTRQATLVVFNWNRAIAVAASVLLCLSIGGYFLLHKKSPHEYVTIKTHDIPPGGNRAVLTLSNGKRILLTGAANGKLAQQGNASVTKVKEGQIEYRPSGDADEVAFNTISTPRGGEYHVVLADGSNIWLNAASSVTYPTTFNGRDRTVEITGEAYFEVAHNAAKPFRVKSYGQTVEVLGTHFNINGYADENIVKTTLLEGIVKVITGDNVALLHPGQQSLVSVAGSPSGILKGIESVDTEEAVAWKNGHFQFDKADVKAVMRELARWYNVEVTYRGDIKERLFSGGIYRNLSASKALELISYEGIHFTIDGNKIIVSQ